MTLSAENLRQLSEEASRAYDLSHACYSKCASGAAVLTDLGIFRGAQLENCAYPNTICSTQAAYLNAISSGVNQIDGLVVVSSPQGRAPEPCGLCLQMAKEFGDVPVWTIKHGQTIEQSNSRMLSSLLPSIFDGEPNNLLKSFKRTLKLCDLKVTGQPPENTITQDEYERLCKQAVKACETASFPVLSDFPVGAAFLTDTGEIVVGGNIETNYLRTTICAERTGMCKALAMGHKRFKAVAVCCYKLNDYGRPCGGCRQNLVEFGDYLILQCKVNSEKGTIEVEPSTTLKILPNAFYPAEVESLLV